jgi:hypothetical protein
MIFSLEVTQPKKRVRLDIARGSSRDDLIDSSVHQGCCSSMKHLERRENTLSCGSRTPLPVRHCIDAGCWRARHDV